MRLGDSFKFFISMAILLTLIFGLSIFSHSIISTSSKRIEEKVTLIEDSIRDGNWSNAETELQNIEEDWDKTKKTWAMLLDHVEIDNIDEALKKMDKFIETKVTSLALSEASTLKMFVAHIPEKEALKLENVF